jgi:hypothetical protein
MGSSSMEPENNAHIIPMGWSAMKFILRIISRKEKILNMTKPARLLP